MFMIVVTSPLMVFFIFFAEESYDTFVTVFYLSALPDMSVTGVIESLPNVMIPDSILASVIP